MSGFIYSITQAGAAFWGQFFMSLLIGLLSILYGTAMLQMPADVRGAVRCFAVLPMAAGLCMVTVGGVPCALPAFICAAVCFGMTFRPYAKRWKLHQADLDAVGAAFDRMPDADTLGFRLGLPLARYQMQVCRILQAAGEDAGYWRDPWTLDPKPLTAGDLCESMEAVAKAVRAYPTADDAKKAAIAADIETLTAAVKKCRKIWEGGDFEAEDIREEVRRVTSGTAPAANTENAGL